jgi:hypothetical protein
MTTPNQPSELDKAIEEASRVLKETTRHENCRMVDESTGVSFEMWVVQQLLIAAKRLKEVEKAYLSRLNDSIKLHTEYKNALEALKQCFTHLGHEIQKKSLNESSADGTQKLSREVAELLDNSTPLTIETRKETEA